MPHFTVSERAAIVDQMLEENFPEVDGFLCHLSAFQLLVATVLSAQCTDTQVNKVTPVLFSRAPDAMAMVRLSSEELEEIIHSVGFFRTKARSILGLSRQILDRFAGKVPSNFADLESLPGVGHKTASVVLGQYFKQPTFPVDTHVQRLARRWKLSAGKTPEAVESDLKRCFPSEKWHKLHLRMISYGRIACTARGCDGTRCEICRRLNGEECRENDRIL